MNIRRKYTVMGPRSNWTTLDPCRGWTVRNPPPLPPRSPPLPSAVTLPHFAPSLTPPYQGGIGNCPNFCVQYQTSLLAKRVFARPRSSCFYPFNFKHLHFNTLGLISLKKRTFFSFQPYRSLTKVCLLKETLESAHNGKEGSQQETIQSTVGWWTV